MRHRNLPLDAELHVAIGLTPLHGGSQQPVVVTLCRSREAGESELSKGTAPP